MQEMHRIDRLMSPYKESSELSRINRDAAREPVEISTELFDLLARSVEFSHLSAGAFDITYASAGHLYDYRKRIRPTEAQLATAREAIGYRHLRLDRGARTVRFSREGVRIDLGGFAKGYAVDNGAAILARHGVRHAVVAAGGDSRMLGDRCGRPWTVGIRDPRREGEVIALLPLEDVALSTSGDYERYFDDGEERCHHLIDPRTGRSPHAVRSVTVIAPDGLTSEALSKTVSFWAPNWAFRSSSQWPMPTRWSSMRPASCTSRRGFSLAAAPRRTHDYGLAPSPAKSIRPLISR
jgi:thiamine biosynthesis lipoprotein